MPIKFLNSGLLEGSLQLTSYGGGSISGTGTYNLGVDASGNVIETSLIEGSGTTNYVVKWTPNGSTLGNSQIFDNGTNVGVGTNQPDYKLDVDGQIRSTSSSFPVYFLQRETSVTGDGTFTSTNGIASGFHLRTNSSGTIQNGFGGGIVFSLTDSGTASNTAARIYARRDGGDTTGALQFWGGLDGTTILSTMRADGSVYFDEYGSGTFTGTAVKNLSITSSGKIIETDAVPANIVETVTTTDGTYINLTPNSPTDGAVTVTADLSAVDGTSGANERYLTKTNKWAEISTIPGTYTFDVEGDTGGNHAVASGSTLELFGGTYISSNSYSGVGVTFNHDATTRNDTTSSASPGVGGTFTVVDLVSTNATGHLERINVKTVTLPDDGIDGSGTLNYVAKFTPDGDTIGDSQIFDNGTNVGIGTTNPGDKLSVAGYITGDNWISVNKDGASTTSEEAGFRWQYNGTTQYWFYTDNSGNGDLKLQAAGLSGESDATPRFIIPRTTKDIYLGVSGGNVGIGTTSPDSKFHVGLSNGSQLRFDYQSSGDNYYDGVTHYFRNSGGNTNIMTLLNGGNVGIGVTSPSSRLHVATNETSYASSLATTVTLASLLLKTHATDSTVTSFGAISGGGGYIQRSNGAGNTSYDLLLNPYGGDVGIGTPVPEARLGVFGGSLGSTSGNSVTHAQIRGDRHRLDFKEVRTANGSDWSNTTYKLQMRVDSTNHQSIDFVSDSSYAEHIDIYTGNQQFNTRFSANGNVGIGTSSPSQKLDVVGSIEVSDGIYLGGTGSANKLDDYEEGTWTLSFGYGYQGGVTSYSVTSFTGYTWTGRYVKIGRLVHCTFFFGCNGFPWPINTSSTVFMLESSLPFAMDSTTKAVNGSYYNFPGFSSSATSVAEVTGVIYPGGYASYSGPGFVADRGFYQNFEGPDTDAFNLGPSTPSFQMKGSFEYYTAS